MAAPPLGAADAPLPPAMAARAPDLGVAKAELGVTRTFVLAVLAGAFISLGAMFATVATADAANLPFGITTVVGGVVFSLGQHLRRRGDGRARLLADLPASVVPARNQRPATDDRRAAGI